MKKLTTLFWLLLTMVFMLSAQTFIDENFNTVPPTGWSKLGNFWTAGSSANAGGTAKELSLSWSVAPNDYLRTGVINTSGVTNLNVSFKTKIDHYSGTGGYVCKLQASSDGSTWSDVWVKDNLTTADYGPATENIQLTEANGVGSATFYLQFIFTGATANFNNWYVDDFKVQNPTNMAYSSSDAIQTGSGNVLRGNSNVKVLQIPVVTTGSLNPLSVSKLTVNAEGSTNLTKISNAKIFYTGTSSTFATTTQFGATVASPTSTDFEISGTQLLAEGTNYFWLTFDVAADAADGDQLDAECKSVTVSGEDKIPTNTDPSGSITIKSGMSGTKTIGTGGDYATVTAALADLNNLGLEGPVVLELKANYVSTEEIFPLVFNPFANSSSVNTVTIRPTEGATVLKIEGNNSSAILDFEGADNVIIDGRAANGDGSIQLTIQNLNVSTGKAIQLYEDSQNNILRYCNISSDGSAATIHFGTSSIPAGLGNDNNRFEFCNIYAYSSFTGTLVFSLGSSGLANSGNTFANNNIYNYFVVGSDSYGINIGTNNTDWTITDNRFYQTGTKTFTTTNKTNYSIYINSSTGNNFLVTGNTIGYAASNSTGTYTITGSSGRIIGIYLSVGTTTPSSVQGNTITAIKLTTTSGGLGIGTFSAINIAGGSVNIGTTAANTIGSATDVDAIVVENTSNPSITSGIYGFAITGIYYSTLTGTACNIKNNVIGGLTANSTSTSNGSSLAGICIGGGAGAVTVEKNIIGGSTANSIRINPSASTRLACFYGIYSTATGNAIINENTIKNVTANGTDATGQCFGIFQNNPSGATTTSLAINNNVVKDITTYTSNTGTGSSFPVAGLRFWFASSGSITILTVDKNDFYNIRNLNTAAFAGGIAGIAAHSTISTGCLTRNKIYDITTASTSNTAIIYGIHLSAGFTNGNVSNNMITLGSGITADYEINGINNGSGTQSIYYNSVLINGTVGSGSKNTHAIYESQSSAHAAKNNIFINQRSGGTGKHYALKTGTTSVTSMDYNNNLYSVGADAFLNAITTTEKTSLDDWKTAFNHDGASQSDKIKFVSADSTIGELKYERIAANAAVFDKGTPITGITTDFYGTARPQYAQVDIGAYELVQSSGLAENAIPVATSLSQNYPNPFNPETTINFALAKDAQINLTVYNAKGEIVKTLVNSSIQAGYHSVNFNAVGLNSGVYFYKLTTPENSFMKKMILVK